VDLTDQSQVTVLLVDRSWERAVVRRVPTPDGLSPVTREEIGQIVAASIEAMHAGSPLGVNRADAARVLRVESEPPPRNEPASGRQPSLAVGVGWAVHLWRFDDAPQQGAQLFGAIELGASLRHRLELGVTYLLPRTVGTDSVHAKLHGPSIRLDWSVQLVTGSLRLRTGVGAGADILFTQAQVDEGSSYAAEPRHVGVFPMARGLVGAAWDLGKLGLDLTVGVDFDLRNADYYSRQGSTEVSAFDPNRFRPFASLRLTFDVLGEEDPE